MALRIVAGASGAGKTYEMCKRMVESSMEDSSNNIIAVVPEQFTMQTQKDIVTMHPNKGVMNIDIVSFGRMAYRVFEEQGYTGLNILDDTGKTLILRRVIDKISEELIVYKNKVKQPGFVEKMKSIISELYQYGIDDNALYLIEEATENNILLNSKIKDIRNIFSCFNKTIEENYTSKEEVLDILAKFVPESELIKRSDIYIDGFTGFTPIQYRLIGVLLKYTKNVIISVTIPAEYLGFSHYNEYELFSLIKKTIVKLKDIAKEENVSILDDLTIGEKLPYRFRNSKPIAHIEKNIFRYDQKEKINPKDKVEIHECINLKNESEYVSRKIFELVSEDGYRYRDIAVVTGSIETYYKYFSNEFRRNNIPCFIDYKRGLSSNPMIQALMGALDVVENNFSYESMFKYLKSGMTDIKADEIYIMENYVIAAGVKGKKRWSEKWEKTVKLQDDPEVLEELRKKAIAPLLRLNEILKKRKSNVSECTEALLELIKENNMEDKLQKYSEDFKENNQLEMEKEYSQTYTLVMELLEKIKDLLGNEVINYREYRKLLESGFEELKVGIIPPSVDRVVVGDIERTRLKDIKALFFVGVNDGVIPKSGGKGGLLSQMDKEILERNNFELSPSEKQKVYIQRFYLYLNLTKPSDKLFVSYSRQDGEGKGIRPSYLIKNIVKLFDNLEIENEESIQKEEAVISKETLKTYISMGTREYAQGYSDVLFKKVYSAVHNNDNKRAFMEKLAEAAFYEGQQGTLDAETAKLIYGERMTGSVSRLEKYAACAYNHFLYYGLKLRERQEFEISVADMGTLIHNSIEKFALKLKESDYDWRTAEKDFLKELAGQSVNEAAKEYKEIFEEDSSRNKYMIRRAARIVERTVGVLSEHVRAGKFEPASYEFNFNKHREVIDLKGRIDRVDIYEENDSILVKVIDYKTGRKKFDIVDAYYGLQIQLIAYMGAVIDAEKNINPDKNIIPAGIFYYEAKDPYIDRSKINDGNEFKMDGLLNKDKEVIYALDNEIDGSSKIVPVRLKKSGEVYETKNVADVKDFENLIEYVDQKMDVYGKEILSGRIDVSPYRKEKDKHACRFCEYKSACEFDEKISGYDYRKIDKISEEAVFEEIRKAVQKNGD